MSDDLYRGRHRAPAGRHRAVTAPRSAGRSAPRATPRAASRSSLPRLTRPGFLLPTAAAATLALTATGAHLGGSLGAGVGQAAAQNAVLGSLPGASATSDVIERIDQERAARGADRTTGASGSTSSSGSAAGGSAADGTDAALETTDAAGNDTAGAGSTDAAAKAAADADAKAATDAAAAQAASDAQTAQAAADAKAAAHAWAAPVSADSGFQLTSGFGMRWGAMHPGQDFAVPVGTPVHALSGGTVLFAGWQGGYGNKLEIQYWDGTVSWFAHNSKLLVAQGDTVTPGEQVSLSGNTGHSTGPHLHVEIHPGNGSPVPPIPWLTAKGIMP